MGNMHFSKKLIIVAMAFYYGGVVLAFVGIIISMSFELDPGWLRLLFVMPGLGVVLYSSILVSGSCKCPYCGYNNWPRRARGINYSLISIQCIRKGKIACPECEQIIEIK